MDLRAYLVLHYDEPRVCGLATDLERPPRLRDVNPRRGPPMASGHVIVKPCVLAGSDATGGYAGVNDYF